MEHSGKADVVYVEGAAGDLVRAVEARGICDMSVVHEEGECSIFMMRPFWDMLLRGCGTNGAIPN
jgi:hypothetical protein